MLLWVAEDRLGRRVREAIEAVEAVFVSAATVWELEIKRASGRLRVPDDFVERVGERGFERLAITFEHARAAGRLPPLHADPFDRVLVAQARIEGMTLATADEAIQRYDVPVLEVTRA